MPPRHRMGVADAVNPPKPMIPGNRSLRKTCSIASADQASARLVSRHLAGLVTSGQLCPDLPGGYVIAGLI